MAKNKDLEFEDDDLGLDLELDDIDFGDGNATPPPKNAREAVTRSLKDVGSGIIGSVTDNPLETATAIAKKSLPPEISSEVNDILDVATSTKEALIDAAGEVKKTSAATIKNLNKLMPKGGRISAMLDKIYDKLGGEETSSGPSKEEIENANIASSIVHALGEQSKLEHVNGMIRDSVENKRHQTTTQIMSNIVAETEHVRKFHYEITNSYYRKSLELQYKSLFVSKEQLEVLKTSTARFTNQFESIVHNTGLPDILKARNSERLKETFKQHMYDEVKDTVFNNFNPLQNLKENLVNRIKSEIGSFKDAMDGVNTGLEQLGDLAGDDSGLGVSKSNMLGGVIGEFLRDKVFGTIGKRVSKTDAGKNIIKNVKNFTADPKAGLRNLSNNLNNVPGVGGALSGVTGFLGDMIDSPSINKAFIPKTDLNGAALFNGRTQDSIVKVIPGLLSKILAEVTYIGKGGQATHGNKSSSEYELNYNFKTSKFENVKDVASNVVSRVTTKNNKVIVKHLPTIINYLEKVAKVKLSKELKSAIEKGIVSEAYNPNGAFSAAMFVDSSFVKKYVPKSEFAKYKSFMVKFEKGAKDDPATVYGGINNSLTSLKKGIVGYGAEVEDLHYRGLGHLTDGMGLNAINPMTGESEYSDKLGVAKSMSGWFDTSRVAKQKLLDEEVGVAEHIRKKQLEEEEKKKSSTGKLFSAAKDKLSSTKKKLTKSQIKAEEEEKRLKDLSRLNISPDESIGYFSSGGFTGKPKDGHVDHTGKEQAGIVHKNEAVIPEKTLFSSKMVIKLLNKFLPSNKQIPESVVSEASDDKDVSVIKDTLNVISKENPGTITKDFINKVTEGVKDKSSKTKDMFTKENVKQQVSKIKGLSREQAEKLEDYLLTNKDMNVWKLIDRDASKFLDKIAKKGEDLGEKIFGSTLWNSSKSLIKKTGRKASKKVSDIANKGEEKALGFIDSALSMFNNDSNSITKRKSKKAKSNNSGFIDGIKNLTAGDVYGGVRSTAETVTNKYDGIKEFLSTQYNKKMFKGVNIDLITKDIGNLLTKGKSAVSTVDKTTIYKLTDSLIIGGDKLYKHLSSIDFKGNAEAMLNEALNYNAENGVIGIVDKINSKIESTSIKNKYIIESDEYSAKDIVSGITKRLNTLKDDGKDYYTKFSLKETKSDIAIHGKKLIDKLLRKARPIEELKKEFYTSWEYENDKSTNFYKWIDENNYSIKDGESTIRKLFKKTREWDRKIMLGGAKLLGKGALGTAKMIGGIPLAAGRLGLNTIGGTYNLGRKIPGLGGLPAYKAIKGSGSMLGNAVGKAFGGTSWLLKEMFNISNPNGSEYEKHKAGLENYYKEKDATEKEAKANKPDGMFKKLNRGLGKFMFAPYKAGVDIKNTIKGQESGDPEIDSFTGYASNLLKGSIATITNIFTKKKKEAEEGDKPRKGGWKERLTSLFAKNPDGKENKSLGKFFKEHKTGISLSVGMLGVVGLLKAMNVTFEDVKNFGKGVWDGIVSVKNVLVDVYNAVKPIVGAVIDMGKWIGEGVVSMASKVGSWVMGLLPDWLIPDFMKGKNANAEPKPKIDANGQPVLDESGNPIMEEGSENSSYSTGQTVAYGAAGYAAYKVGKGVYKTGKAVVDTGKAVVGGAKAVASGVSTVASAVSSAGGKVADVVGKATDVIPDKKGIASKIISTLESFKDKILKKLGPKAAKKMLAGLAAKIAARAVPIVGWGLLIYDASMVIKYMTVDDMEFKSAVSKAVLGFDVFNDDEPMLDENGEPIKPDEDIAIPEEVKEETKVETKEENKEEKKGPLSKEQLDKLFENDKKNNPEAYKNNPTSTTPEVKKEEKQEPTGLLGILSKMFGKGKEFVNNAAAGTTEFVQNTYSKVKEVGGAVWEKIKNLDIGGISAYFESGGRGPGTVSSGNGDFGGVSYGTHQLASKTGTLKEYLNSSVYGKEFNGLVPGSPQFTAKWKEIAAREPDKFAQDQEDFIKKTHYLPQVNKLSNSGLDVTSRSPALQSAVYSAAVQFGPKTGLIQNAISANNIDYNAPDEQIIKSIYDYKKKNNDKLFKSSSAAVRKGTLNRAVNEENMVLKLLKESGGSVGALHKEVGIDLANKPPVPSTDTASGNTNTSTNTTSINTTNDNTSTATTTVDKQPVVTTPPAANKPVTLETVNKNESNTVTIDKSNNNLKGIEDINTTLVKSLEVQIRMANTLDKILEVSSRNMSPEEAKKIANSNKPKPTSELPKPTVNMSKSA